MNLIKLLLLCGFVFGLNACSKKEPIEKKSNSELLKEAFKADGKQQAEPMPEAAKWEQFYAKESANLGALCSVPATVYCGKVTKDLNITKAEFFCLLRKTMRATREVLHSLDGSKCAGLIERHAQAE